MIARGFNPWKISESKVSGPEGAREGNDDSIEYGLPIFSPFRAGKNYGNPTRG
jgi:hypothetical protein